MGSCLYRQYVVKLPIKEREENFLSASAVRVTPPPTLRASFSVSVPLCRLHSLSLSHFLSSPLTVPGVCKHTPLTFPAIPCGVQKSARTHGRQSITSANNGSDACGKSRKHGVGGERASERAGDVSLSRSLTLAQTLAFTHEHVHKAWLLP